MPKKTTAGSTEAQRLAAELEAQGAVTPASDFQDAKRELSTTEAQQLVSRGQQVPAGPAPDSSKAYVSAMAPGLVRFIKVHRFPEGRIYNADVPFDKLPTQDEITDQATGLPRKGYRFKTSRGNVRVDF